MNNKLIVCFSCTLFFVSCIDVVQFHGIRVLLIPSFIIIVVLYFHQNIKHVSKDVLFLFAFIISSLPSLFYSENLSRSIIYSFWPAFNFISLFIPFYILGRLDFSKTIYGIIIASRLMCFVAVMLWFLGYHERVQGFFYESSYFSIGMALYFVYFIYKFDFRLTKINFIDITLMFLSLVGTKSGSLVLIIIFSIIFRIFRAINNPITLFRNCFLIMLLSSISIAYINYNDNLLSKTIKLVYIGYDNPQAVIDRTGNRYPRLLMAVDALKSNPLGVGVGAYISYIDTKNFSNFDKYPEWLNPYSKPAINIYIEIGVTCGWIASIVFILWNLYVIFNADKSDDLKYILLVSFILMLIILQIESNYLRPYLWCVFGLLASLKRRSIL